MYFCSGDMIRQFGEITQREREREINRDARIRMREEITDRQMAGWGGRCGVWNLCPVSGSKKSRVLIFYTP